MDKKFYVTPEMEIEEMNLESCMMLNTSGTDPGVYDDVAEGDPDD